MNNITAEKHSKPLTAAATKPILVPVIRNGATTPSSPINNEHKHASYASDCPLSHIKSSKSKTSRDQKASRSFFNCIGKHLGCHFLQHNTRQTSSSQQKQQQQQQIQQNYMYNSQDDLPSSSTDSFSLSYERGSQTGFHLTGSNIDLTNYHKPHHSQHTSRNTLSSTALSDSLTYSPAFCSFDVDCLIDIYNGDDEGDDVDFSHKVYQQHQHHASDANVAHSCNNFGHNTDCTNSSSDEAEDDADACSLDEGECCKQQKQKQKLQLQQQQHKIKKHDLKQHQRRQQQHVEQKQQNLTATTTATTTHKRIHLSRLSIASSVTRMLNHLASSTSMRSLSCSSTPLRCFKDAKPKECDDVTEHLNGGGRKKCHNTKKHSLPNTLSLSSSSSSSNDSRSSSSGSNSSSGSGCSGSGSGCNSSKSSTASTSNKAKKEKKQQSILRPPVHYVYMKGMSGLYSRVPRYTVCSPYAMH
ncbi:transcription factor kayak [Eurosta solidaginis]|uniref:transcription factor kayak n=1 Tax=Eurosta solidaginis TaxID=178769 RepID=UPI00353083A8